MKTGDILVTGRISQKSAHQKIYPQNDGKADFSEIFQRADILVTGKTSQKSVRYQIYYGVPTISRLLKITGLFCRISSFLWGSFAKETYNFKEPTNRSLPICAMTVRLTFQKFPRRGIFLCITLLGIF